MQGIMGGFQFGGKHLGVLLLQWGTGDGAGGEQVEGKRRDTEKYQTRCQALTKYLVKWLSFI